MPLKAKTSRKKRPTTTSKSRGGTTAGTTGKNTLVAPNEVASSIQDDFPYRNLLYTDKDRIDKFKNLIKTSLVKTIKPNKLHKYPINIDLPTNLLTYEGKYYYIKSDDTKYFDVFILSDLFNDDCRMKCSFAGDVTPYDYYTKNKNKIESYLRENGKEVTPMNMRNALYNFSKGCSVHNPAIIKYFIDLYGAKRVLDMSSGWGDRLLGSMAAGVDLYYGSDPNKCLHKNYKRMIELLVPHTKNPNMMIYIKQSGFEDVDIPYNDFDLAFTSPPYFDYEIYTRDTTQSMSKYNNAKLWLDNFLKVCFNKIVKHIRSGGHIVFYISQQKRHMYMEEFIKYTLANKQLKYLGCMYYTNMKYVQPHPIFIWKKL